MANPETTRTPKDDEQKPSRLAAALGASLTFRLDDWKHIPPLFRDSPLIRIR